MMTKEGVFRMIFLHLKMLLGFFASIYFLHRLYLVFPAGNKLIAQFVLLEIGSKDIFDFET